MIATSVLITKASGSSCPVAEVDGPTETAVAAAERWKFQQQQYQHQGFKLKNSLEHTIMYYRK
jgi:hypothetical protein